MDHSMLGKLRSIDASELELMLSWRNAQNVRANMYTQHEISLSEHLKWWGKVQSSEDQKYFMYELQGTPLGVVALTKINTNSHNSSWAFYAAPKAPKGTGSRMEFLALEYAFNQLKLHKLYCEVLAFNSAVINLHQKFGFKVEGIFREQHMHDSAFVDVYRLGMLATEWSEQREHMAKKFLKQSN